MRKLTVIALTALTIGLGFSSCKKDKDSNTTFTGTWNVNSMHTKASIGGIPFEDTTANYKAGDATMTFNEDKSFIATDKTDAENNATGTYSLSGNTVTITSVDMYADTTVISAQYSISGKNMTLTSSETDADLNASYELNISLTKQ